MVWNVYNWSINKKSLVEFNVFEHYSFLQDVEKLLQQNLPFDEFQEELRRTAQYYFWSRCEYEIVITNWPYRAHDNQLLEGKKVDVFDQLKLNWNAFAHYVYNMNASM